MPLKLKILESIEYREYKHEDKHSVLSLRNSIFPPISSEDWKQNNTATVAIYQGEVVGVIPFTFREFTIAPGVNIMVASENSVGVREDLRGKGVGSEMMRCAKSFLPKYGCQAMFVYREDERSAGYRFYRKTGHFDIYYPYLFILNNPRVYKVSKSVDVENLQGVFKKEKEILSVFNSAYGCMGGFRKRCLGYWKKALTSHIFVEIKYDWFKLMRITEKEKLKAYAIIGKRQNTLYVLEFATFAQDGNYTLALCRALSNLADKEKCKVEIYSTGPFSSYFNSLQRTGFELQVRNLIILGYLLDLKEIFDKLYNPFGGLENTRVKVWTPKRELVLYKPKMRCNREVTLQMKEWVLHRFLLSRLDIKNSIRQGLITLYGADENWIREFVRSIPFTEWIYHHIDYI